MVLTSAGHPRASCRVGSAYVCSPPRGTRSPVGGVAPGDATPLGPRGGVLRRGRSSTCWCSLPLPPSGGSRGRIRVQTPLFVLLGTGVLYGSRGVARSPLRIGTSEPNGSVCAAPGPTLPASVRESGSEWSGSRSSGPLGGVAIRVADPNSGLQTRLCPSQPTCRFPELRSPGRESPSPSYARGLRLGADATSWPGSDPATSRC